MLEKYSNREYEFKVYIYCGSADSSAGNERYCSGEEIGE
jgi:hypothetical protein